MTPEKWDVERTYLRGKFINGDITKATRKELERYLVVLANARVTGGMGSASDKEETEKFAVVVRHLLQVRLGEELHHRSWKISVVALIVSVIALVLTVLKVWHDWGSSPSSAPPTVSPMPSPQSPAKK